MAKTMIDDNLVMIVNELGSKYDAVTIADLTNQNISDIIKILEDLGYIR